jgi:hypothetical protein
MRLLTFGNDGEVKRTANFMLAGDSQPPQVPSSGSINVTATRVPVVAFLGTVTVSAITGGIEGCLIIIQRFDTGSGTLVVQSNSVLRLVGDFSTATKNSTLMLMKTGSVWVELSRSSNT